MIRRPSYTFAMTVEPLNNTWFDGTTVNTCRYIRLNQCEFDVSDLSVKWDKNETFKLTAGSEAQRKYGTQPYRSKFSRFASPYIFSLALSLSVTTLCDDNAWYRE